MLLYLPFKLLGINRIIQIKCYNSKYKVSQFHWKFNIPEVEKPKRKVVKEWRVFIRQLKEKKLRTAYDFCKYRESKMKLSTYKEYL